MFYTLDDSSLFMHNIILHIWFPKKNQLRCGTADLRSSQVYPAGYGEALVKNHQKWTVSWIDLIKYLAYTLEVVGIQIPKAAWRYRWSVHLFPRSAPTMSWPSNGVCTACWMAQSLPRRFPSFEWDTMIIDGDASEFICETKMETNDRTLWIVCHIPCLGKCLIFPSSVLFPIPGMPCCCCKAPYRFRHAALTELRDFLVAEKKAGRFHPLFSGGLEWKAFPWCVAISTHANNGKFIWYNGT